MNYSPAKKRQKVSLYDESWGQLPEFQHWLEKSKNNDNARCKYCNEDIAIYFHPVNALRNHQKTNMHYLNTPVFHGPLPIEHYVNRGRRFLATFSKKYNWDAATRNYFLESVAKEIPEDAEIARKLAAMNWAEAADIEDAADLKNAA